MFDFRNLFLLLLVVGVTGILYVPGNAVAGKKLVGDEHAPSQPFIQRSGSGWNPRNWGWRNWLRRNERPRTFIYDEQGKLSQATFDEPRDDSEPSPRMNVFLRAASGITVFALVGAGITFVAYSAATDEWNPTQWDLVQ